VAAWLLLAGWLGTAVQGFFYKIASFLVWLRVYAPVAGIKPVPRLEELYGRHAALAALALWVAGVVAVALTLSWRQPEWTRLAALLVSAGGLIWLANVLRVALPRQTGGSLLPGRRDVPGV
jgi:hypothetical protein